MRRLFIAINLPKNIKKEIKAVINNLQAIKELKEIKNIRWMSPENWHLTISFLGYQPDSAIDLILKSMQEVVHSNILENVGMNGKDNNEVKIEFEKIVLAPPNKSARMIWLTTTKEISQILSRVKDNLENNLIKNSVKFKQENRGYNGHITIARFASTWISADIIYVFHFRYRNGNSESCKGKIRGRPQERAKGIVPICLLRRPRFPIG